VDENQVVVEETPSPDAVAAAEPTPETQVQVETNKFEPLPGEVKTEEVKAEQVTQATQAQSLVDWAVRKYPELEGKNDTEKVEFLIARSIESNKEGRRLAREVKELRSSLEDIKTRDTEIAPETDILQPEPTEELPNVTRYESRVNRLQEKQNLLATRYSDADQTITERACCSCER